MTNRDIRFESDHHRRVTEVMTPMPLVTAPPGVQREEALRLLGQHKVEKLPLVDAAGRLRGLITVKDFAKSEKFPQRDQGRRGRLLVGAAVGVGEDAKQRAQALATRAPTSWSWTPRTATPRRVLDMIAQLKANVPGRRDRRQRGHQAPAPRR